jgi:cell division protein FtsL
MNAQPVRKERIDRSKIEEERRKKSRRDAARRNRERAMYMSPARVLFLSACVALSVIAAVSLVQIQAQTTQRMKHIANLESQLTNLRADNDAKYKEIVTSVDLNHIKDVAINELGMTYASEEQIVYFSIENENFMDQYGDIPE